MKDLLAGVRGFVEFFHIRFIYGIDLLMCAAEIFGM